MRDDRPAPNPLTPAPRNSPRTAFASALVALALTGALAGAGTAPPATAQSLGSAAGGGTPPRVTVYFDLSLTGPAGMAAAARSVAAAADDLTALGPVEVVVADRVPETVVAATTDAAALRRVLGTLAGEYPGAGALAALRRDFADEMRGSADDPDSLAGVASDYLAEEQELLERTEDDLASRLSGASAGPAATGGTGSRLLVLVADGFDLDPTAFYLRGTAAAAGSAGAVGAAHRQLADRLVAGGWRVVALALGEPALGLAAPTAPLAELAAATGGAVVTRPDGLAAALAAPGAVAVAVVPPAAPPPGAAGGPGATSPTALPTQSAAARQPTTILLLPPRGSRGGELVTGKTRFQTLTVDPAVARAVFYLDGTEAATDDREPFAATLDLGPTARPHTVRVVAYSAGGRLLGEHSLTLNQAAGTFRVAITHLAPVAGGKLEVAADVEVPADAALDRVEVYRNETLAARLARPPFRAAVDPPGAGGQDYVRVVAVLADGRTLDDARLLDEAGIGERVNVNLVELFVIASDKEGDPVRDLGRDDFTVRMGGEERPIERFQLADEVPLLLGVLIDTSESMWVLMPDTKQAASKFLADTLGDRDRAFLVDFSDQPHLAQAPTGDLLELLRSFGTLAAHGATALYDSIVFSLFQFEDVPGRRALVLLTDGQDYGSRFGPGRCIDYSRELGVPVYIISLAGLYADRRLPRVTDLEGITGGSGGRIYYITQADQLGRAYAQINGELRSQYVLGLATDKPLTPDELKSIKVDVHRPGVTLRTVVGPNRPAG